MSIFIGHNARGERQFLTFLHGDVDLGFALIKNTADRSVSGYVSRHDALSLSL